MSLNRPCSSRIVPAMKTTAFLLAIVLAGAVPAAAQSTEFGVLFGGSARSTDNSPVGGSDLEDDFSFSRSAVDFYYGVELDPGTWFKLKAGRIETPVGLLREDVRYDVQGHVQHLDATVEYRFSEPLGSAGIYAGIGMYRSVGRRDDLIPEAFDTTEMDYGFLAGITADFPLTRRYGVVLDASRHWTRLPFEPVFSTLSGGIRVRF